MQGHKPEETARAVVEPKNYVSMKKFLYYVVACCLAVSHISCAKDNGSDAAGTTPATPGGQADDVMVVYFSQTGTTEDVARHIADITGAGTWRIEAAEPYTAADLDYSNPQSRSSLEQNDPDARPEIKGSVPDLSKCRTIYLGYPIWWGQAPRVVYTFVESCNLSGKTVIPFCTSGSSGIGSSATLLQALAPGATWTAGRRFGAGTQRSEVEQWIKSMETATDEDNNINYSKMNIKVNGRTLTATMADNSSARALIDLLKEGDIVIDMSDYGNFEKVGSLGHTLPQNNENITTEAGDLILYQGNNFVIYYDTNTWNFTRLGKIDGISKAELKELLGKGNVTVTLSARK